MGQSLHLCVCVCLYEYKRKGYISFIQQKNIYDFFSPYFWMVSLFYIQIKISLVCELKRKAKKSFTAKEMFFGGFVGGRVNESKTFLFSFALWRLFKVSALIEVQFPWFLLILLNYFVIRNSNNAIRYFNEIEIGANIAWWFYFLKDNLIMNF